MRFIETEKSPPRIRLKKILKILPAMGQYFQNKPVDLIFIHGSLAKDNLKHLSDIDVAVLFKEEHFGLEEISKTIKKFSALMGREDIDLMILNRASPLARMQVLCNGKILYCRSKSVLKKFRLETIQRYLATQYLRTSFNKYMQTAILRKK